MVRQAVAVLVAASGVCLHGAQRSPAQDHLEPETGTLHSASWQVEYHDSIRRHLVGETNARPMARMICLPSFSNEWAVSVVEDDRGGTYHVELALAEDQVWGRRQAVQEEHDTTAKRDRVDAVVAKIRMRRVSRPIDEATAKAIHALWLRMLLDVRHPREEPELATDGEMYHFSSFRRGRGALTGKVHSPWGMTPPGKLARIGESLRRFAECPEADRAKALATIKAKVQELDRALEGQKGGNKGQRSPARPGGATLREPRTHRMSNSLVLAGHIVGPNEATACWPWPYDGRRPTSDTPLDRTAWAALG